MTAWLVVQSAIRALRANLLRTLLTMLGVIIGVGAVIAMVSVGTGAQARVAEQIQSLGSNLIMVRPGAVTQRGARLGRGTRLTISEDDARAIQAEVSDVVVAAPMVRGSLQAEYGNLNWATTVHGVTPEYFEARDWDVTTGRLFSAEEAAGAARVVLVGQSVAGDLFAGADPVGQIVRVNKVPFTVVGVLEPKGQSSSGQDQDDVLLVPITTARARVLGTSRSNPGAVHAIAVKLAAAEGMTDAEEQMRQLLRQRHRLKPNEEDDFSLRNLADVLEAQEESSRVLTLLLAAIASVSLLVGGIGIMNIMLVSVVERTREIGLRMAVGARARDILRQFLLEAVTLSLVGGGLGAALGTAVSIGIGHLAGWTIILPPEAIAVAVGFAAVVGVFFGFYPARRAARLDPIEALRYE
ncbi:MAG: ABC transporter permease [Candidatus Rokubacteria bacterium]|nr:ABC transporter permease [Candidatus Rokubacteria bacterium]